MTPDVLDAALQALDQAGEAEDAVAALVRRGLDRNAAADAVRRAALEREAEVRRREERRRPLAAGVVAGVAGALAAGCAWAFVFVHTGDRLGPLAWLVGIVAGAAVAAAARTRGRRAQFVAVGCAAVGFLLGKYLTFALPLHGLTGGRVLSFDAGRTFARTPGAWGYGDALYAALALWGAWGAARVPRPRRRPIV